MGDDIDDGEPIEGLSFWEPSGYKRTTKRITDGNQLCNDLVDMVQERCDIEAKYASWLKNWSKKWAGQIDKGPEYGSTESAWKAVLTASDREADVHIVVKDNLINTVQSEVRRWQKDNFHKGIMSLHLKEKKEMDEEFKKVQKPWIKKLKAVEKYKQDYHNLCQKEQSAALRERNSQSDSTISEDQRLKIADEVAKLGSLKIGAKANYEDALRDLNSYNPRYMEDMKEVYMKCQEMENRRLDFFKERLLAMHKALDLSNAIVMKQIYADYLVTVENANAKSDLKWWDIQRGVDMPMSWPQFEEFSQRLGEITNKSSRFGLRSGGDSSTITGGTFKKKSEEPAATSSLSRLTVTNASNGINGSPSMPLKSASNSRDSINRHSGSRESVNTNPFGSDDEEIDVRSYEEHASLNTPMASKRLAPHKPTSSSSSVGSRKASPSPARDSLYPALPRETEVITTVEEKTVIHRQLTPVDNNPFADDTDDDVIQPVQFNKSSSRTKSEEKEYIAVLSK